MKNKKNNYSEEQKQKLRELQIEVQKIRQEGKFILFYRKIRRQTSDIWKNRSDDITKKYQLKKICSEMVDILNKNLEELKKEKRSE